MDKLSELLPGKTSTNPEDILCYGFDASGLEAPPSAVVWPQDVTDVIKVMEYAYTNGTAVIPRGAGTGMTGGAVPLQGAIILSMEKMNRIIEIDEKNLTALVEPGVLNGKLQRELQRHKLFYPPDPASMNFVLLAAMLLKMPVEQGQ
jgi:glycolate oxidase